MAFAWRLLPDTSQLTGSLSAASLARDYRSLLRLPSFVGYAIGGGCATTSIYAFIVAAPFIFVDQLHRSQHEVGIYLGVIVAGMSLGNALTARLIRSIAIGGLMEGANALSATSAFKRSCTVFWRRT